MGRQLETIIDSLGTVTLGTLNADVDVDLSTVNSKITAIELDTAAMDSNIASLTTDVANGVSVSGTVSAQVTDGTIQSNLRDGSGNALTSTVFGSSRRLDVNLSSAGTTGSATPSTANLYGGTDGTNLRAVSVDTSGRLNANLASVVRGTTTTATLSAGTSQGTLFATNSTRNYLLIQCTSGTAFVDTNGTAATTSGIQLTSGQGIVFESSFIPTGTIVAITSTGTAQLIGRQG